MRKTIFTLVGVLSVAVLWLAVSDVQAGSYQVCRVPPVAAVSTRPNLLLVMDYSGSMQFPAYVTPPSWKGYWGYASYYYNGAYADIGNMAYNKLQGYYGLFDSDTNYVYNKDNNHWEPAETQPTTRVAVTKLEGTMTDPHQPTDGVTEGMWVTTNTIPTPPLVVGSIVALSGLSRHAHLNGKPFEVLEVSGNRFRILAKFLGHTWDPDRSEWVDPENYASATVIERVPGTISTGLSGDILNYFTTSRIDAALRAITGGRADCVDTASCEEDCDYKNCTDKFCYLKGSNSRYWVRDTNLQVEWYVRPATTITGGTPGGVTFPDDWNTCGSVECLHTKTTFVTVMGRYRGKLDHADNTSNPATARDPFFKSGSSVYYEEVWQMTLTEQTRVMMQGYAISNFGNVRIRIYSTAPTPSSTDPAGWGGLTAVYDGNGRPINVSTLLNAGTYYVRVSRNSAGLPTDSGENRYYQLVSNVPLSRYVYPDGGYNSTNYNTWHSGNTARGGEWDNNTGSTIGTIPWAQVRVKLAASSRRGVIQQSFGSVRWGFMMYNWGYRGRMMVGCQNESLCTILNAFDTIYPYNATPTGEALREAYDYFRQTNSYSYYGGNTNSAFWGKGTVADPYFQQAADGSLLPVPCRKSSILLVSDGQWNGWVDPVKPALQLHTQDLRTDGNMPGQQSVNVYTVYAFGDGVQGENAMKATAAYGKFTDVAGCGAANYPYGFSGSPGSEPDSRTVSWPRPSCNPGGTYDETCCKEWDEKLDLLVEGDGLGKGLPDSFFKADSGEQLASAISQVLADIQSQTAAASAAATVAQQSTEGDFIVRGMFQAQDPSAVGRYLWYGHLEVYWPYYNTSQAKWMYEFEECISGTPPDCPAKKCYDDTATRCWDGAKWLKQVEPNSRNIFTARLVDPVENRWENWEFPTSGTVGSDWETLLLGASHPSFPSAAELVSWIRGSAVPGLRVRTDLSSDTGVGDGKEWRLGDIVYSTPVVVGTPSVGAVSTRDPDVYKYYAFRNQESVFYRDRVIYVGANDGMVHAFRMAKWDSAAQKWKDKPYEDPSIGEEIWAYIPSSLLSELKYLSSTTYGGSGCSHRAMVDLSPAVWAVFIKSSRCPSDPEITENGRCWRNVVMGGLRGGGDTYFAIDVTDPNDPVVLWEYSVLKNRVVFDRSGNNLDTCATCMSSCGTLPETPCCDPACKPNLATAYPLITSESNYQAVKNLPMAWSRPYVGRIQFPDGVDVPIGDPSSGGTAVTAVKRFFSSGDYSGFNDTRKRHVAFVGGGMRHFENDCRVWRYPDAEPTTDVLTADRRFELFRPDFMAIDIETGRNFFRYWWPYSEQFYGYFPVQKSASDRYVPYALSDPLAIDVWSDEQEAVLDDGFTDRIYVGDITGRFYEIALDFDPIDGASGSARDNFGIKVTLWYTKSTGSTFNRYRTTLQPITSQPAASFTRVQNPRQVHVVFGSGKYDDIHDAAGLGTDDKTDTGRMSIYNLLRAIERPTFSNKATALPATGSKTVLLEVARQCLDPISWNSQCRWVKSDGSPDCCNTLGCGAPANPTCWACVADFVAPMEGIGCDPSSPDNDPKCPGDDCPCPTSSQPAERVVSRPLIAGGYVFVTTYIPSKDICSPLGHGYLYVLSYDCGELSTEEEPLDDDIAEQITRNDGGREVIIGYRLYLGGGVPSHPVLDSKGESVTIQMGSGKAVTPEVKLKLPPFTAKGWRER